jgi:hypothetical protein
MNRGEIRFVLLANLLVGGTGVAYAAMKYLMKPTDEWSIVNHPWQPHAQHLHVLLAPMLALAGGLLWRHHVTEKLRSGSWRGRRSGLLLVALFVPMIASGSLIQISVAETWRQVWVWVHLVCTGFWLVAFLVHWTLPRSAASVVVPCAVDNGSSP